MTFGHVFAREATQMEDHGTGLPEGQSGQTPAEAPLFVLPRLPLRFLSLSFSTGQGAFEQMTTATERSKQVANCRLDTWARLMPVLSSLHVSRSEGPEVLVQALHDAPLTCKAETLRVLRAMGQRSWSLQRLTGPYASNHRLGFCIVAGAQAWWLSFEPGPHLRLKHIEKV
jgi:hypothetical protein